MKMVTIPNPTMRPAAVGAIQWIELLNPVQPNLVLYVSIENIKVRQGQIQLTRIFLRQRPHHQRYRETDATRAQRRCRYL